VVTAVTTLTNDNTPSYVFSSDEAGTNSYGGSCGSSTTSATSASNNNTVILTQPDNSTALSDASYSDCTITVTDSVGNASTALSVNTFVVDATAPTVDNVSSSTAGGDYFPGDNITITVGFNETVYVDNSSGNPRIQLAARSDNNSYANYISGNSTSILSFLYTVQSGDNFSDLDYKATDSLSANAGTIRDNANNDATLTLASPGASNSLASNKALVFGGWKQEAYIKTPYPDLDDIFGNSVSIDGDTLVVGANYEDSTQTTITNGTGASSVNSSTTSANSGAVYVYKRSGTSWAQEAYIKAANNNEQDKFGFNVSLDNDTLAVGAPTEQSNQTTITNGTGTSSNNSINNSGAVYVYKRSGSTWAQEAYIKAANNDIDDSFGGSGVSIEGDTLAVSAQEEDSNQTTITNGTGASSNNSNSRSGAVYVYKRSGSTWAQEAYIKAVNSNAGDIFGSSISIDGDTLAVGAKSEASNQTTITNDTTASSDNSISNSGAVYVYKRSGSNWAQEAYIKAANNHTGDKFGFNVSLDNDTLAVGVPTEQSNQTTITNGTGTSSDNTNSNSGAVYVYKRSGSTWAQEAYIKAVNNDAQDFFGSSISIDGDILAVGAEGEASNQTTITNGTGASSNNSNASTGAVYVYKRSNSTWAQEAYIKAANNDALDYFGDMVSIDNGTLAVGVEREDSNQNTITNGTGVSSNNSNAESGAVYVYSFFEK
jgi:hypothetical protein